MQFLPERETQVFRSQSSSSPYPMVTRKIKHQAKDVSAPIEQSLQTDQTQRRTERRESDGDRLDVEQRRAIQGHPRQICGGCTTQTNRCSHTIRIWVLQHALIECIHLELYDTAFKNTDITPYCQRPHIGGNSLWEGVWHHCTTRVSLTPCRFSGQHGVGEKILSRPYWIVGCRKKKIKVLAELLEAKKITQKITVHCIFHF